MENTAVNSNMTNRETEAKGLNTEINPLFSILDKSEEFRRLQEGLCGCKGPAGAFGLGEAQRTHIEAALFSKAKRPMLVVVPSEQAAARVHEELCCYYPDAVLFPARELPLNAHSYVQSQELTSKRLRTAARLIKGEPCLVVAPIEAVMQRMAPPSVISAFTQTVRTGMVIEPASLLKKFIDAGYSREEMCEGRGQVCLRGGCIDIFPITAENPVRIEFFDDEIDTMREFDPLNQRSTENTDCVEILPATELPLDRDMRQKGIAALRSKAHYAAETEILRAGGIPQNALSLLPLFVRNEITLLDYLPEDALIILDEPSRIEESARFAFSRFTDNLADVLHSGEGHELQAGLLNAPSVTMAALDRSSTAMLFAFSRSYQLIKPKFLVKFDSRQISRYVQGDTALRDDIGLWRQKGFSVLLYAGRHAERLHDILSDLGIEAPVTQKLGRDIVEREIIITGQTIPRGFEYPELRLAVVSEYELFGSEYRPETKPTKHPHNRLTLYDLSVGDLVVHEAHGIGRFTGVSTLTVDGKTRDYIELCYRDGDKLFIPTDQMDRVQKYIGGEEEKQKLSKLGSGEWQKTVARTRASVRKLAFDLVKLYGERARRKGFRFSKDTDWQQRLELSFPYRETPDQLTSIREIKADMESDKIMDRLLCGDVGYGKTEVALRAAFKCAMDGKQCAFLVPTTILAQQHYNTLCSRYSGFPIKVELLSRFRTPAEQARIKKQTADGTIDILVGTHSILSKDVKFKDLGLLIIDEEQRFGVNHKEQIKNLKRNIDVLTLSATPIPRTLHMSMSGIRDMSVIETPPEARYPVQTFVVEYNDALVREAIMKELARGGQVYIVYNIVKTMDIFAESLSKLVPEARIAYAHGQMSERRLENTMMDFMDYKYDVLICSTIIESGLDISNANTMIVYDADKFGLSQLYQLRGRVGRGARLGYAYLTFRQNKVLSEIADKRLSAIKEFTQFGAGFRIAMRDLEIRGAGDILGAEQHGHMAQVGYDLYCKMIDAAVKEAKGETVKTEIDTVMEIPIDAHIPKKYIPRETGRISMYKRIAAITDIDSFRDVQDELIDRYGEIPRAVQNLLDIALYKSRAAQLGILNFTVHPEEVRFTFGADAPLDGAKLLAAVGTIDGAAFAAGEKIALVIKNKHKTGEEMFRIAQDAVNTLLLCTENAG